MIRVEGLSIRSASGTRLLDDVSFTAEPGTLTAITGPSGSGKTLLLWSLIGHMPAKAERSGTVLVGGRSVPELRRDALRDLRRRVVSYVGQDPGAALEPTMRVGRTLAETAARPDLATNALAQLGLPATYVRRRAWELSGGEQRRVALARALLRENPVLLADEPFAGLDHDRRGEVAALLREYSRKHDAAVLISGHDVGFLRAVCDREVAVAPRTPPAPAPVETVPSALVRGRGPESETGTEPGPPIFSARGLRASFRGRPVLDGVGLSLSSGEITGLSGPSGSGKTTLARTLAGLRPADEGELVLAGSPLALRSADRSRAQRLRVQLIPQDPASSLNPRRDALGAVSRPARLRGLGKAAAQQLARELIAQVGLPEDCCRRFPGELSGGQRQRVCVARALAAEPLVLLCDEITSALDWDTGCSIVGLLRSIIAERPFAVLFVCHDKRLVEAACDRVLFLADGKLAVARRSR